MKVTKSDDLRRLGLVIKLCPTGEIQANEE